MKDRAKEEIGRELGGLMVLAEYSPWCFGRYITFEVVLLLFSVYCIKTGKRLTWTDPD